MIYDQRSYTHNLSSCEIKPWKNSGLNGIRTHNLCDTGAVLGGQAFFSGFNFTTG